MTSAMETISRARLLQAGAILLPVAALLSACISITPPDKPIEINLNVNIRQEVVVSLREDVKNLDQQFPGVF